MRCFNENCFLLCNYYLIENDIKFLVYLKINERPKDDKFDAKCELPIEDPEDAYCGPEYFRSSSREEFRQMYYSTMINEGKAEDLIRKLKDSSTTRCERAIFKILHPFTCVFDADTVGRCALWLYFKILSFYLRYSLSI